MSKARFALIAVCAISLPVYWWDARIRGVWDSEGVIISIGALAFIILEPLISVIVRSYFAQRRARKERERRASEIAEERARLAETARIEREREEAEAAAERRRQTAEADEAWRKRQKR